MVLSSTPPRNRTSNYHHLELREEDTKPKHNINNAKTIWITEGPTTKKYIQVANTPGQFPTLFLQQRFILPPISCKKHLRYEIYKDLLRRSSTLDSFCKQTCVTRQPPRTLNAMKNESFARFQCQLPRGLLPFGGPGLSKFWPPVFSQIPMPKNPRNNSNRSCTCVEVCSKA